jgi:hypothetical protein
VIITPSLKVPNWSVIYINTAASLNRGGYHRRQGGRPAQPQQLSLMTHKYRGSQQSSRKVKPKFIDLTQGEPKNIYKL